MTPVSTPTRPPRLRATGLRSARAGPFDFTLAPGDCLAITGLSGAGKSLLLRMIADLDPHEGDILLDDRACAAMPAAEWRRQAIYSAAESGWWLDRVGDHFPEQPTQLADALALRPGIFNQPVATCSTGERQRLALLRALGPQSPVLLLDEPTGALDPDGVAPRRAPPATPPRRRHHPRPRHPRPGASRTARHRARPPQWGPAVAAPWTVTPVTLGPLDIALAASLIVIEAALSLLLGLGIHKQVGIASARMVVQLLLVGYALRLVFALASPVLTLLAVTFMALVAAREVAVRPEYRLARAGNYVISLAAVAAVTALTSVLALTTAIRPHPWWTPQYAIPLAGIILGSVLNSASIALDHVLSEVRHRRVAIEAQLALGATYAQATRPLLRSAIRRGTLPIINQMSAAGLITLPGIMTGQILAGLDPVEAVKYQILLMFLLAGSSLLAGAAVAILALRRLTDPRDRLRLDGISTP